MAKKNMSYTHVAEMILYSDVFKSSIATFWKRRYMFHPNVSFSRTKSPPVFICHFFFSFFSFFFLHYFFFLMFIQLPLLSLPITPLLTLPSCCHPYPLPNPPPYPPPKSPICSLFLHSSPSSPPYPCHNPWK